MTRVLVATRNPKKLVELQRILTETVVGGAADRRRAGPAGGEPGAHAVELIGLDDLPAYEEAPETGLTFGENALLKAREGVRYTGLPTVADDSGLAVDALNGMPGVFSARWAGRHGDDRANLDLLLAQLSDVADERRGASFVCAAALVLPGGREHLVDGTLTGRLLRAPRGEGGFGYDPIFIAHGQTRSNAELTPAEKDAISHRGQAFRALAQVIVKELGATR